MAIKILSTIFVFFAVCSTAQAGVIVDQFDIPAIEAVSTGMDAPFDLPNRSVSEDDSDSNMECFDLTSSPSPAPGVFYETPEMITYHVLQGTLLTLNASLPRPPILDGPIKPPRKNAI